MDQEFKANLAKLLCKYTLISVLKYLFVGKFSGDRVTE